MMNRIEGHGLPVDGPPPEVEPFSPGEPKPTPVRLEKPLVEEDEMGGEAPCQLHRFWDVEE